MGNITTLEESKSKRCELLERLEKFFDQFGVLTQIKDFELRIGDERLLCIVKGSTNSLLTYEEPYIFILSNEHGRTYGVPTYDFGYETLEYIVNAIENRLTANFYYLAVYVDARGERPLHEFGISNCLSATYEDAFISAQRFVKRLCEMDEGSDYDIISQKLYVNGFVYSNDSRCKIEILKMVQPN